MAAVERTPLSWPNGWRRTSGRQTARFRRREHRASSSGSGYYQHSVILSMTDGLVRLKTELDLLGAKEIVITRSAGQGGDPGISVFFTLKNQPRVLACDKWLRAADNMAAIAGHIAAIRAVDRYGVGTLEQAFAGYSSALPAKGQTWRSALGFGPEQDVTQEAVEAAYRGRAKLAHPDVAGGSHDAMSALNSARAEALAELG